VNPLLPPELVASEVVPNATALAWAIWRTDWASGAPAPAPPIAYVSRVDTVGGATPTACTGGGPAGDIISVPFEATYKLYNCPSPAPAPSSPSLPAPAPASAAAAASALGAAAAAAWWAAAA
jgi:hypothetical protein